MKNIVKASATIISLAIGGVSAYLWYDRIYDFLSYPSKLANKTGSLLNYIGKSSK